MQMSRHARSGFTLAEILIAIAIVAIMAMIAVPAFNRYQERAKKTSAKATLKSMKMAIESFQTDTGTLPETLSDVVRRPMNEEIAKEWQGPYLEGKDIPKDPWKNSYQYTPTPGAEHEYDLHSYGPKGKNAPQAEWISVWDL